jgi:MFS family permease
MTETRSTYGWVILAVATFALVVSNGIAIGGLPPFYKAIREEFVASGAVDAARAESFIAVGANITFLMAGVFSLIGGWLLTFIRLKTLMLIGCVLLGGGLLVHAGAQSIEAVYLARLLMGASLGFVGVAPAVVLVSQWFREKRGTAIGILLTGTSIGGVLIPLIAAPLIAAYGWRLAMVGISSLVWLVLLPAVLFLVRENREIIPVGVDVVAAEQTFGQTLKMPLFWVFGLCAALVFYPIFVTSQQFILYLQSPKIGLSLQTAAFAQSALFAVSIGGKFLAGFLSDKVRPVLVMVLCAFVMFAATLVLFGLTASTALLFLLPFAFGYGGTFVLLQRLATEFFGRSEIGKVLGALTLIEAIGAAVGGRITGYLADQAGGDYTYAFYGVAIAAGLAFLTTLVIFALSQNRERTSVAVAPESDTLIV